MHRLFRLALLISGGGTTMEQILFACRDGVLEGLIEPALVIASKENIGGTQRAIKAGVPIDNINFCSRKQFLTRNEFGHALLNILKYHQVDIVLQAGWTPMMPSIVVSEYQSLIFNQHPEYIRQGQLGFGGPKMVGLTAHQARLLFLKETNPPDVEWFTEVVCHQVTTMEEFDDGEVVWTGRVPVKREDTAETLNDQALPVEWAVQIAALHAIATGTLVKIPQNPVIKPGQEKILEWAKAQAIKDYPVHG